MNEHHNDDEKLLERFIAWKKEQMQKSDDISNEVMESIKNTTDSKAGMTMQNGGSETKTQYTPRFTSLFLVSLLKPKTKIIITFLIIAAGIVFFQLKDSGTSTQTGQLAMSVTRTKGESFKVEYLVQRDGEDTLQMAPDSGIYAARDKLQPFYWSDDTYYIVFFSAEADGEVGCLNCSGEPILYEPAQGKPLPLAFELDDSPKPETIIAIASKNVPDITELKRITLKCMGKHLIEQACLESAIHPEIQVTAFQINRI